MAEALRLYYDVSDQLVGHVSGRFEAACEARDAWRDRAETAEEIRSGQQTIRRAFARGVGPLPVSRGLPRVRVTGRVDGGSHTVEKLLFEARPGAWVTANLYLPRPVPRRAAGVLALCGHFEQAKALAEYQVLCQMLAHAGIVTLIYDPVGQGERLAYYDPRRRRSRIGWGCPEHEFVNWQGWPLGGSPARYFLDDAVRALDVLAARPEVDPGRIGVTGSSGGGSLTCALMMSDPRVAAAAPATWLSGLREYARAGGALDSEETWPAADGLVLDHEDVLFSFAPRPVIVLAARSDFFPIEGTRRTVARARRAWQLLGNAADLELFEDDAFHSFTVPMAGTATAFFSRHLLGREYAPEAGPLRVLRPAQLRCTKSGQVSVDIPGSRFILDENRAHLERLASEREKLVQEEARAWLLDLVMTGRRPVDPGLRIYGRRRSGGLASQGALWWSQERLFGHGVLYRDTRAGGKTLAVDVGVGEGGTGASAGPAGWVREVCGAGRAALVLDVSGCGALEPPDNSGRDPLGDDAIMYRLAHTLFRLGDSLVALRVYDVIRTMDALESWPGVTSEGARLHGWGRHGLYAELAAFIDGRVQQVSVEDGMGTWAQWVGARNYRHRDIMSVTLPGVLEHFDLPDVELWLGSRFRRLGKPGSPYAENRRKVGR
jgi:dienelactone hydrolase